MFQTGKVLGMKLGYCLQAGKWDDICRTVSEGKFLYCGINEGGQANVVVDLGLLG